MLKHIAVAVGVDVEPVVMGEASHEIHAQYLDSTLARTRLGWEPAVGLEEGLRRTADWYRRHLQVPA